MHHRSGSKRARTRIGASILLALAATGAADAARLTDASRADIRTMLDLLSSGEALGEMRFGELASGQAVYVPLDGDRTVEYYVHATCDDDCANMDLAILDVNGNELDTDDADDNVPVLNVHADLYRSQLDAGPVIPRPMVIEIRMIDCKAETCGYGLLVTQAR